MGGCGPVVVMGTGPYLGGGPAVPTGPDPAGRPRGRFSATASAHGGISSRWMPDGDRALRNGPSGILVAARCWVRCRGLLPAGVYRLLGLLPAPAGALAALAVVG